MMPCGSPQPGRCSAFLGVRPSFREPSLAFGNGGTATYEAIFCRDIPLHSPYIGLISGRYLQFRFPKWQLKICMVSFWIFQISPIYNKMGCIPSIRQSRKSGSFRDPKTDHVTKWAMFCVEVTEAKSKMGKFNLYE